GAAFTSLTTIVIVSESVNEPGPLSVTRIVTTLVVGPWFSVGVHVKRPVAGLIEAPAGAPGSRVKVRVCGGKSVSVAIAVKERRLLSRTVLFPIDERTGPVLTSATTMEIVSDTLCGGTPLS